jgi:hypothetical protein
MGKEPAKKYWMDSWWLFLVPIVCFFGAIAIGLAGYRVLESNGYQSLDDIAPYHHFVQSASVIGLPILIASISIGLIDLVAMSAYVLRSGRKGDSERKTVIGDRVPGSMSSSAPGVSKEKILLERNSFVSMESLADGSASRSDRLMVAGIVIFLVCFFLVFLGWGLFAMKDFAVAILFPIIPGIVVFRMLRQGWRDFQLHRSNH